MPLPKPVSDVEAEIFEFIKESDPSTAYLQGADEYVGKIFIPSRRGLERVAKRADELRLRAENTSQLKAIDSMSAAYALQEPQTYPDGVLTAFFGYLIKEGIIPSHLKPLTRNATRALEAAAQVTSEKPWPTGLRLLTLIRCDGLLEIIKTIRKETTDKQLKELLEDLALSTKKYASIFRVKGFKNQGFDEVYRIIKREGAELGREKIYAQALRRLWDYPETPNEVEAKGLKFLEKELPRFKRVTARLARKYGVPAKGEDVSKAITAKRSVKQTDILPFLGELRKRTERVVNKDIVKINPKYETKIIETPLYLSGMFPSAGAFFYDGFTKEPKEIFMITTDPRRDPSTVPGELLNGLVHEEYGHCVHASNTAIAYGAKPTLTDTLFTPLSALSEGISFHREIEFQEVMDKLKTGKGLNNDEKALVQFFEKRGGLETWAEEYEFYTWMWRIVRFLRVIGDARINSGKQSLVEFIEWAHKKTGLAKSTVYHQLFPAHQGYGPGYASTYAIIGESIREIQNRAKRNGKNLLDFNTYACSMGFPARTIFEQRLRDFAAK
ncbi:MAG TPA: hypothetical protein VE955_08685 [Candidatus Dormibacteraeota bacterium]|jgi:hypothetical protein|nr:hypothetical protein [Candidatus Dormibacteraeota bacterium]